MHDILYDFVKAKYGNKRKLCYMDRDSLIVYIKPEKIFETLQKMLNKDLILQIMNKTDHYLKEKNKEVIGSMKD